METTTLCSSILPSSSSLAKLESSKKLLFGCKRRSCGRVFAKGRGSNGSDYRGRLVDESMIVLRKRIHEMKVIERNYEPPAEWMEWEKQHFARYDEFICEIVGLLQSQLMNTRPSLALGMLMIVSMSVPASAGMLISHLMGAANEMLSTVLIS